MTDKILTARYGTHVIHNEVYVSDWEGIDTLWNVSQLVLGDEACCILLGQKLMPYYSEIFRTVQCQKKHHSNNEPGIHDCVFTDNHLWSAFKQRHLDLFKHRKFNHSISSQNPCISESDTARHSFGN